MIITYRDRYADLPLMLNFNHVYRIEVEVVTSTREQKFGAYCVTAVMPDGSEVLYYGSESDCVAKFDAI